ncbi:DUF3800 domain-containing protein [Lysobacter sp. A6]|uniref:DUF3800 domain-containing protein n=1 Tax=Noviluteimonas lactosilytica TaxID=2888523 RepID=A0ABS8JHR7_9GAMM|nr:DUF3800 domain-containing protein [Lysobacter lactosilyticus]MCC8363151.1 DUF3800 domain-containing protein [Lysobacter lactosilyticus]
MRFGDYIVYVDESGDHGVERIDPEYPIFALAFCVFRKAHYVAKLAPSIEAFKFRHFGHDAVVLHEHDIRKEKGAFRFDDRLHKQAFLAELTDIIDSGNFTLISGVIDKRRLAGRQREKNNPYTLALRTCLESLHEFIDERSSETRVTHVVVECRGAKEDRSLGEAFRGICNGANRWGASLPFELVFADKKINSPGLQIADLVARPLGIAVFRPGQPNRALGVLADKRFPPPESEKPRRKRRG